MPKALVVDDEAPARSELRCLLDEVGGVEIVGEAGSVTEALQLIKTVHYDVIFLDIHMPGLSGVQLAEALSGLRNPPAIVFVTAHSEHAVKAFEVHATDYLVKPIEVDRLKQAIARVGAASDPNAHIERIPVEKTGKKLLVAVNEILYVMAKDDYVYIHTASDRYFSTVSLGRLESKLEPEGFFRIHRRYLVNLSRVTEVVPVRGGTMLLTLSDDARTQIRVSRRRVPALKKALQL